MNEMQCLEKQLELMKMCEGTRVKWWECVQTQQAGNWENRYNRKPFTPYDLSGGDLFALAIVEDKPVFEGDELYADDGASGVVLGNSCVETISLKGKTFIHHRHTDSCSWNPPKPRTVMVELTVEDAEWAVRHLTGIGIACRKALEELK